MTVSDILRKMKSLRFALLMQKTNLTGAMIKLPIEFYNIDPMEISA